MWGRAGEGGGEFGNIGASIAQPPPPTPPDKGEGSAPSVWLVCRSNRLGRAIARGAPLLQIEPRPGDGAKFREETPTEASCQRSNLIRKRICVTTPHKQRGRQLECGAKLGNSPERSPSSLPMPSRQIHQDAWLLCLRVGHRRRMDLTRCAVFVAFLAQPECSSTSPAPLTSATLRGA